MQVTERNALHSALYTTLTACTLIRQLRLFLFNCWNFANVYQYLYIYEGVGRVT